jgi:hypothetical protein
MGWRDGTNDGLTLNMAELQRIEALEETPMPDQAPSLHDPQDWVARHSPRYAACAHRARLAASLDEDERLSTAPPWSPDDAGEVPFGPSFDITPAAIGSAMDLLRDLPCPLVTGQPPPSTRIAASRAKPPPPGTDPRLIPPVSVSAARRLPDYAKPHGWKAAMSKEVARVEKFGAWRVVRYQEYRAMSKRYPGRTSIGCYRTTNY